MLFYIFIDNWNKIKVLFRYVLNGDFIFCKMQNYVELFFGG